MHWFGCREEANEYIEIGALNGLFVLGRSIGFIGKHHFCTVGLVDAWNLFNYKYMLTVITLSSINLKCTGVKSVKQTYI